MEKKHWELKIIKTVSELLPFVQNGTTACVEFLTLRTKLADAVWRFAALTFGTANIENASVEIMECVNRSVLSYKGTAEHYINYIASALKQEIIRANKKLHTFNTSTISLPDKKQRTLHQLCSEAKQYGKDLNAAETQIWLAERSGYPVSEIAQLIKWKFRTTVKSEYSMSKDGEEISLFEYIVPAAHTGDSPTEAYLLEKFTLEHVLQTVDAAFTASQNHTKPYLSALLIHRILYKLDAAKIDRETITGILSNKTFAGTEHGRKLIRLFFESGTFPTQEDIAAQFGKDKTDASRTISVFIKKLQKICQPAE